MTHFRQVVFGVLAALLSTLIIFGSLSLALTEGNLRAALVPTTFVFVTPTFVSTPTPSLIEGSGQTGALIPTGSPTHISTPTHTPPSFPTVCPHPAGWSAITVQPGDTLNSLANAYQTTPEVLAQANCLLTGSLVAGSKLYVPGLSPTQPPNPCGPPPGWIFYTVQKGDNLFQISQKFGISVAELKFANCLTSDLIRVGQKLYVPNVPTRTTSPTPRPRFTRTPTPTEQVPTDTPTDTPQPPTPTDTGTPTETPLSPYPLLAGKQNAES